MIRYRLLATNLATLALAFLSLTAMMFGIPQSVQADENTSFGVQNNSPGHPAGSPIQIESCETGTMLGSTPFLAQSDRRFHIAFTNEGNVTADLVRFYLTYGEERFYIRDKGSFAPGITINHSYNRRGGTIFSSPIFGHTVLSCEVVAIHFTNGTNWTSDSNAANAGPGANSPSPVHKILGVLLRQTNENILITAVISGSAAEATGLQTGDILKAINGMPLATVSDANAAIQQAIDKDFLITIMRNGQTINLMVKSHTASATP